MSNVLVFSIALNGFEIPFSRCIASQRAYCDKYGYRYVLVRDAPRKLFPTEAAWIKIPLMKAALDGPYEWVVFLDADIEVRPHTPCIVDTLSREPGKSLFFVHGHSGRVNSGVLIARKHPTSKAFFDEVLTHADVKLPEEDRAPYENGHVIHYAKSNPSVHLLDHYLWNNNSILDQRAYLQHYSSGPLRRAYLGASSPSPLKSFVTPLVKLSSRTHRSAMRRLGRFFQFADRYRKDKTMAQRMSELLPHYSSTYPVFRGE
jgi:hypothetical protein